MHDLVYLQGYLLLYLKQIIKHFKYKIGKDRKKSMLIFYNTKEFFAKYSPEKVTKFDYTFWQLSLNLKFYNVFMIIA